MLYEIKKIYSSLSGANRLLHRQTDLTSLLVLTFSCLSLRQGDLILLDSFLGTVESWNCSKIS